MLLLLVSGCDVPLFGCACCSVGRVRRVLMPKRLLNRVLLLVSSSGVSAAPACCSRLCRARCCPLSCRSASTRSSRVIRSGRPTPMRPMMMLRRMLIRCRSPAVSLGPSGGGSNSPSRSTGLPLSSTSPDSDVCGLRSILHNGHVPETLSSHGSTHSGWKR